MTSQDDTRVTRALDDTVTVDLLTWIQVNTQLFTPSPERFTP